MKELCELYVAVQGEGSRCGRPTIVVRTTGCTHRCFFRDGGWCDSWYTSIHPERGQFTFSDVVELYDKNPNIKEMMITGGSPTMYPKLLNALTELAWERGIFTTIETEGSHYIETTYPIDLVSISPKFSNSVPILDEVTPLGKIVDEKMIIQHNKFRLNFGAIRKMIEYHNDYQIKPVWSEEITDEIVHFITQLDIPNDKVWLMPAGDRRIQLIDVYGKTIEKAIEMNWNFSGREHIIAYDKERNV